MIFCSSGHVISYNFQNCRRSAPSKRLRKRLAGALSLEWLRTHLVSIRPSSPVSQFVPIRPNSSERIPSCALLGARPMIPKGDCRRGVMIVYDRSLLGAIQQYKCRPSAASNVSLTFSLWSPPPLSLIPLPQGFDCEGVLRFSLRIRRTKGKQTSKREFLGGVIV